MKKLLSVSEIFSSVQGESTFAGLPCFFVRLAGCNLNCRYCDTLYARDKNSGRPMDIDSVLEKAKASGLRLAEVTGGEPLTQENCPSLCAALIDAGLTVLVETNGSLPISALPERAIKIMDIKTPSSGEAERFLPENISPLSSRDEVKFVISDEADYLYTLDIVKKFDIFAVTEKILLSPAAGLLSPERLAEWMLRDKIPARLQIQLHKHIWGPDKRGV
jgi:7-carboxy-7-deazaguanine synthase